MGSAWDEGWAVLFGIFALVAGLFLLVFGGLVIAIAYYLLLLMVWHLQHRQYRLAAGERYDEIMAEHGDFAAEDVAFTLFGARPGSRREHSPGEILFGVEVKR